MDTESLTLWKRESKMQMLQTALPPASASLWGPWGSWVCGHLAPTSLSLCGCVGVSYEDTCHRI